MDISSEHEKPMKKMDISFAYKGLALALIAYTIAVAIFLAAPVFAPMDANDDMGSSAPQILASGDESAIHWDIVGDTLYLRSKDGQPAAIDNYYSTEASIGDRPNWEYEDAWKNVYKVHISGDITYIGFYTFERTQITSIDLSDASILEVIGCGAFKVSHLESIKIPATVREIQDQAFQNCVYLKSMTILSPKLAIQKEAFKYSFNLEDIYVYVDDWDVSVNTSAFDLSIFKQETAECNIFSPNNNADGKLDAGISKWGLYTTLNYWPSSGMEGDIKWSVEYDKLTLSSSSSVNMRDYTSKDQPAWISETILRASELFIDNQISNIGAYAFYGYDNLREIVILGDSVRTIDKYAFCKCHDLVLFEATPTLTELGEGAFMECTALKTVNLSKCRGLTPNISDVVFEDCTSLTSVILPDHVTSLGFGAFDGCSALGNITMPKGLISIGNNAFKDCTALVRIDGLGTSKLEAIGYHAFHNCSSLLLIDLPATLKSINYAAFIGCSSVKGVIFEGADSTIAINANAFAFNDTDHPQYCYVRSHGDVFNGILDPYKGDNDSLKFIYKDLDAQRDGNISWQITGNTLMLERAPSAADGSISDYDRYLFPEWEADMAWAGVTKVQLGSGITSIGDYAFYDDTNLNAVHVSDGKSITEIGSHAFSKCSSLITVGFNSMVSLTTIGDYAFEGTGLNSALLTNCESLTTIGNCAFLNDKNLVNIRIPANVTAIGIQAFAGCENMKRIDFLCKEWNISVGDLAFSLSTISAQPSVYSPHNCADGKLDPYSSSKVHFRYFELDEKDYDYCSKTLLPKVIAVTIAVLIAWHHWSH